ncbi:FkbM family methyltransferase [Dickeya zeae]|uniref:FkbM family methyltransferase n=1 Tax=Dickeya zeae TaxID=204042 RepID=UPI000C9A1590|nr:FkbM family methyltransferase [Dickeya zeae]AUQ25600.1 hypothetical protein C1O30_11165 [Dickeya zeae]UJR58673.1 FkbM family methyltransferase [Dickeya zeae]
MLQKYLGTKMLEELRERLINIEAKQDGNAEEFRIRLANIEKIIIDSITNEAKEDTLTDYFQSFTGSSDQSFGHITYSQHGEDMIIANIFSILNITKPTYLDIGANHPLKGSNTALLYSRGSHGTIVDANPNLMNDWKEIRPHDTALNVGVSKEDGELPFYYIDDFSGRNTFDEDLAVAFVTNNPNFKIQKVEKIKTLPINKIVSQYLDGKWPDFLSLDVEGLDYDVLESADFSQNRPTVICAEILSGEEPNMEIIDLLVKKGFYPAFRTIANIIAVNANTAKLLGIR